MTPSAAFRCPGTEFPICKGCALLTPCTYLPATTEPVVIPWIAPAIRFQPNVGVTCINRVPMP